MKSKETGEVYTIVEPCRIIELNNQCCTYIAGYRTVYKGGDIYHVFCVPSQSDIYIKTGDVDTESGTIKATIFRGEPIKPTIKLIAGVWHKRSNAQEWFKKVFVLEKLNRIKFSFNGVEISIDDKNAENWEKIHINYRMEGKELMQRS